MMFCGGNVGLQVRESLFILGFDGVGRVRNRSSLFRECHGNPDLAWNQVPRCSAIFSRWEVTPRIYRYLRERGEEDAGREEQESGRREGEDQYLTAVSLLVE